MDSDFWHRADDLVASSDLVIDRPKGSRHPNWHDIIYQLDYGYLTATNAMDGSGIDVWRGSKTERRVTAAIVTIDTFKRDAEVKLLVGCTDEEVQIALAHANSVYQSGLLILRHEEK